MAGRVEGTHWVRGGRVLGEKTARQKVWTDSMFEHPAGDAFERGVELHRRKVPGGVYVYVLLSCPGNTKACVWSTYSHVWAICERGVGLGLPSVSFSAGCKNMEDSVGQPGTVVEEQLDNEGSPSPRLQVRQ